MTITVIGMPGPQGSKRFVGHAKNGRGIMIESSAKVKPWREAVKWAVFDNWKSRGPGAHLSVCGAVSVEMIFTLPKPKSAPKKRVTLPDRKPDLSKLVRATEDALTDAGAWEDDARVVSCRSAKRYPGEGVDALNFPGAIIRIEEIR